MLGDESLDDFGQLGLGGQLQPFDHVLAHYGGAHRRLQLIVRVAAARLVFHEELRLLDLPDVVIVDADTDEEAVGIDRSRRCLCEISHVDGVSVGAGSFQR